MRIDAQSRTVRALLALLAFALSLASASFIYQRVPTGADENSYVFQAHNFRDGVLARPAPPLADCFRQEMIILDDDAGWLSRYPPGHPLWLLPGVWLGDVYVMIALAAAVAVWFACAAAAALGLSQLTVGLLLLLSPFFCFMYGTQLSHTSGLAAVAVMLWAYVRGRQGARLFFAVAGLAWSLLFLNRTYSALLLALPFGVAMIWRWLRERRRGPFLDAVVFAGSAAVGVLAYLAYNRLAVGDAFTATYLFYEPSEGLGFGARRTQGMAIEHTLSNGLRYLGRNLLDMDRWLFGFSGSLLAAAALALAGWSRRWTPLLLGATATVWLGYVCFWYPGVQEAGGPAYFFETLVPVVLLVAFGLQRIARALAARPAVRTVLAGAALLALAGSSVGYSLQEGRLRAEPQRIKRRVLEVLHSAPPHALVLIENLTQPHIGEMAFNPRGLESDPLLLRSLEEDNAVALRVFPGRAAFVFNGLQPEALRPIQPQPIRVGRHTHTAQHQVGRNESSADATGAPRRTAREGRDRKGWLVLGKDLYLPAGRYSVEFQGELQDVDPERCVSIDVTANRNRTTLAELDVAGSRSGVVARLDFEITNRALKVESRVRFGGSGSIALGEMIYTERADGP